MTRNVSIRLTDEDYDKLMKIEGETRSDKIRKLLGGEENYFTKQWNIDHDFTQYSQAIQTVLAIGVLINKLYGWEIPEEIIKSFKEGDLLSLFLKLSKDINEDEKYDDLKTFISTGLLDYYDLDDPEHYLIIGQILADKFIL